MKIFCISKKNYIPLLFLFSIIILLIINLLKANKYITEVSAQYRDDIPIYSVECEGNKCAITFDCAWGADDIPTILDTLDKYEAKATFFLVGIWARKYPETVKLIYDRGHEIANHGYSHAHMSKMPENKIEEEILLCTQAIEEITCHSTSLFRPPYGDYDSTTIKVANRMKYFTIQWDIDSLDWRKNMSKEDIFKRVTTRMSNGSIILFHNDTLYTSEVLPSILENLKNEGYEFLKISDLIIKDNYRIRYDGRQIKK